MKGLFVALVLIGGAFYFIHGSSPSGPAQEYASATGEAIEITAENYEYKVKYSDAPMLAYYWSPS